MVTIHNIQNPNGLDKTISVVQTRLKNLIKDWGNVNIYGLAEPGVVNDRRLPLLFKDGEYKKDALTLELGDNKIFFIDNGEYSNLQAGSCTTEVKTIFMLDLSTIYSDDTHRRRQDAIGYATDVVNRIGLIRNVTGVETDLNRIFAGYNLAGLKVEALNVQPRIIFAIKSRVKFYINNKSFLNCCKR